MKCKICQSDINSFAQAKVLGKYIVNYYQCSQCRFVQTESPYWLNEAYSEAIALSDVGLVSRNLGLAKIASYLIFNYFDHQKQFLDYGGGYGLFVRLMRDRGFDFHWCDRFCANLFAKGFELEEAGTEIFELVTAFELFEHFVEPIAEIERILSYSDNIFFSTELLPDNNPKPQDWHYYALHEGQHIAIYTPAALKFLAQKYALNFYSNGNNLHLMTKKDLRENPFAQLRRKQFAVPNKGSFTQQDYLKIINTLESRSKSPSSSTDRVTDFKTPRIIIDGVFFQLHQTGIARVWHSLMQEWVKTGFACHLLILDRGNTAPRIEGLRYRTIPRYSYQAISEDRNRLQQICDQEKADLFVSTYYTTPISTPSVFIGYDMIPENLHPHLKVNTPQWPTMWQEKHHAISYASAYITISENTARDLAKYFPKIEQQLIVVAHCGVSPQFYPAQLEEIRAFKNRYGIEKPYFLICGGLGVNYKNHLLFFQALGQLETKSEFEVVCTGENKGFPPQWQPYIQDTRTFLLKLSDEDLRLAYCGAVALIYPSKHEGFGLPILEAMACECPVITCPNSSIPEVAGKAAIYVNDRDVDGLTKALSEVQKPSVRRTLIQAGLERIQGFTWESMAEKVKKTLLTASKATEKSAYSLKNCNSDLKSPQLPLQSSLNRSTARNGSLGDRIGLVVTTYNSEDWFKKLYDTIPFHKLDECVIVNGGKPYTHYPYDRHTAWIQHHQNYGACQSRIDGITYLLSRNIEHIFIVEDDMLIKNENIFERYIKASKKTGLKYLCFCSNAPGSGKPFQRTPKKRVDYSDEKLAFYANMNNEFTYHHADIFTNLGFYDTSFKHLWDVEFVYRIMKDGRYSCGFWWFPDVNDADLYIENMPESINNSRTNVNNSRNKELPIYLKKFIQKHGYHIPKIPVLSENILINKLKELYEHNRQGTQSLKP